MNDTSNEAAPPRNATPDDTLQTLAKTWTYSCINREERHLVAILFHVINSSPERMEAFLRLFGIEVSKAEAKNAAVYFEYALLRDIWHEVGKQEQANEIKRNLILEALKRLGVTLPDGLDTSSVEDFNRAFRGVEKVSTDHIESPSNWSVAGISKSFSDNDDFRETCKFKWAFNIKPDLVIQLKGDCTVCVEAKLESGQSSYPSSDADRYVFSQRGSLDRVGQLELQEFMFSKVLGFNNVHFTVIQKRSCKEPRVKSWADVFKALKALEADGLPAFMNEAIKRASKQP